MARKRARQPMAIGSSDFDALVGLMRQIVIEETAHLQPRLGTVHFTNGNEVNIRPWGEDDSDDDPRGEGLARNGGHHASKGDTFILFHMGDGVDIAVGPILKSGQNPAVISGDEIMKDAIDQVHIRQGAIGNAQLQGDSVDGHALKKNVVTNGHLDNGLQNSIQNAATKSQITGLKKNIDGLSHRINELANKVHQSGNQGGGGGNG